MRVYPSVSVCTCTGLCGTLHAFELLTLIVVFTSHTISFSDSKWTVWLHWIWWDRIGKTVSHIIIAVSPPIDAMRHIWPCTCTFVIFIQHCIQCFGDRIGNGKFFGSGSKCNNREYDAKRYFGYHLRRPQLH